MATVAFVRTHVGKADTSSAESLENALKELDDEGFENLSWDQLKLVLHRSHASNYLADVGSWDGLKREITRGVLQEFRDNFHQFPRPW